MLFGRVTRFPDLLPCVALLLVAAGCGDDGGATSFGPGTAASMSDTGGTTEASPDTSSGDSSSGGATSASSGSESGSGSGGSSTGSGSSSTGSAAGDPNYPEPVAGACEDGVPVDLPGGSICEPLCTGADAPCPAPATGDAAAECIPFEQDGGSGQKCTEHRMCPDGEACDPRGLCISVAFWACQLSCGAGETCPDPMVCTGIGACGYP